MKRQTPNMVISMQRGKNYHETISQEVLGTAIRSPDLVLEVQRTFTGKVT